MSQDQPRVSATEDCTRAPVPGSSVHGGGHQRESATVTQLVSVGPGAAPALSGSASHALNSYQLQLVLSMRSRVGRGGTGCVFQNHTCQGDLDLVTLLALCTVTQAPTLCQPLYLPHLSSFLRPLLRLSFSANWECSQLPKDAGSTCTAPSGVSLSQC